MEPLKIALISPSQNPYSETFVQAHKNGLEEKVFYYYGTKGKVQLEDYQKLTSSFTYNKWRLWRKLFNKSYNALNEKLLIESINEHKIDVILVEYGQHCHNLLNVLNNLKQPVVVHFHGYDASVHSVILQCYNYKYVFDRASKVIAVSHEMQKNLASLGCPKHKLVHNLCGPDSKFKNVVPKYSQLQFIALGRFTEKKSPYSTIEAFSQVLLEFPNARLLMGGEGELLQLSRLLVEQKGIEDQVEFLGVITPEKYRELLSNSIAFVQHSVTANNGDKEGTPVAILEASLAGLPVIATRHAGIPDVIIHGKTGLLCDEHDIDGMATHMLKLLHEPKYAKELGSHGKIHIWNHFNMDKQIAQLQTILEDVCQSH